MVLYYSATGNSAYVARRIAEKTEDERMDLFDRLRKNDVSLIDSEKPFVIVTPTYGWQIPHILRDWLKRVKLTGSRRIYFVMTCGGDIGNAAKYLRGLCEDIHMDFMGCAEIVMPENYIALFDVPEREEALKIIDRAEPAIDAAAEKIRAGEVIEDAHCGIIGKIKSGIVNVLYYPLIIHSKKFTVSDSCIRCGNCESVCVMNNIKVVGGRPQWQDNCTHCMACICTCPVSAIEYGSASKGKPRYSCPKS